MRPDSYNIDRQSRTGTRGPDPPARANKKRIWAGTNEFKIFVLLKSVAEFRVDGTNESKFVPGNPEPLWFCVADKTFL